MADFQSVIDAGRRLGEKREIDSGYYTIVANGDRVEDLEKLMDMPRRIRANAVAHDRDTFIDYFNTYKNLDSRVFADRQNFNIVGILDYHGKPDVDFGQDPGWCSHSVTYTLPRSPEWITWTAHNGKRMQQSDFAQFVENNVDDIREPSGADMLEVSRNLQAKRSVDFSSAIRLANGEQEFTYSELIQGSSSKGKMTVPETFSIGIPVFMNGEHYAVEARLRYRISDSKLLLWYDLYQPQRIEADAFNSVVTGIANGTGVGVWMGGPG